MRAPPWENSRSATVVEYLHRVSTICNFQVWNKGCRVASPYKFQSNFTECSFENPITENAFQASRKEKSEQLKQCQKVDLFINILISGHQSQHQLWEINQNRSSQSCQNGHGKYYFINRENAFLQTTSTKTYSLYFNVGKRIWNYFLNFTRSDKSYRRNKTQEKILHSIVLFNSC